MQIVGRAGLASGDQPHDCLAGEHGNQHRHKQQKTMVLLHAIEDTIDTDQSCLLAGCVRAQVRDDLVPQVHKLGESVEE